MGGVDTIMSRKRKPELDFGLEFQGWYATMHSPLVWRVSADDDAEGRLTEVEGEWVLQACVARDNAFDQIVDAARQGGSQATKRRRSRRWSPRWLMVTCSRCVKKARRTIGRAGSN